MRLVVSMIAVTALLDVAGCGATSPGPCPTPPGCSRAERVNGTCGCAEWETVSVEPVALPFVIVSVDYALVGSASVLRYGFTPDATWVPESASRLGATVRAVVRRPDGSEQVAKLGTPAEVGFALDEAAMGIDGGGVWTITGSVDSPSPREVLAVWVNPAVTLVTNYIGEKTVSWSSREACFWSGLDCTLAQFISFSASQLRGEAPMDAGSAAYLDTIGPDAPAALLAFDARTAGGVAFPRYQYLGDVAVGATTQSVDTTWNPCPDPGELEVLAETTVPLDDGDTFVLQYVVKPDAACTAQRPGLLVGSATPDCSLHADVFVDRLFGTILMEPSAATDACTR